MAADCVQLGFRSFSVVPRSPRRKELSVDVLLLCCLRPVGVHAGSVELFDAVCRGLCAKSGAILVSVEYKLAPEHKYPEGLEDGYAAVSWAAKHAHTFGGNAEQLAVAGEIHHVSDVVHVTSGRQALVSTSNTSQLDACLYSQHSHVNILWTQTTSLPAGLSLPATSSVCSPCKSMPTACTQCIACRSNFQRLQLLLCR